VYAGQTRVAALPQRRRAPHSRLNRPSPLEPPMRRHLCWTLPSPLPASSLLQVMSSRPLSATGVRHLRDTTSTSTSSSHQPITPRSPTPQPPSTNPTATQPTTDQPTTIIPQTTNNETQKNSNNHTANNETPKQNGKGTPKRHPKRHPKNGKGNTKQSRETLICIQGPDKEFVGRYRTGICHAARIL
jgi:hypothetical protein